LETGAAVSAGELGGTATAVMALWMLGGCAEAKEKTRKAKWEAQGSAASAGLDVVRFDLALPHWAGRR